MPIIADLHIHSRYSRATGKELNLPNLEKWALVKGVDLLGTGDFTHPKWIEEIKENLEEDDTGILRSKSGYPFVLQADRDIACDDSLGESFDDSGFSDAWFAYQDGIVFCSTV